MNAQNCDCLSAGIVVADHVCQPIDHLPAPGELVLTSRMGLSTGGCASNVAVDLSRLRRSVSVMGKVGTDVFGRYVKEALESAGVGCEHLGQSTSRDTSGTFVINTRGEDRRFIHSIGANAEFSGREVTPQLVRSCRVLYLGGYCLIEALSAENVAAMFREAKSAGVTTLLDVVIPSPGDYWPMLRPVLPFTDVFLPNDDEAALILGQNEPLAQAEQFHKSGAKTVVVTCGANGAVLVCEGTRLRSGVYDVDFVDGTGSGDAFAAGYIHGLLEEGSVVDCLRYGSALGASCVRATGATTGVFTPEQLQVFVEAQELTIDEL